MDVVVGLIVANAEDIAVRTIRRNFALGIATLFAVGTDSLYSKQQMDKNLEECVALHSFRIRGFQFRFLYASRHFISILAMQEERNAVLTSVGCWRYLKLGLGSFRLKELEEGHCVTDWPIRRPRGVCRQGAGRTAS